MDLALTDQVVENVALIYQSTSRHVLTYYFYYYYYYFYYFYSFYYLFSSSLIWTIGLIQINDCYSSVTYTGTYS